MNIIQNSTVSLAFQSSFRDFMCSFNLLLGAYKSSPFYSNVYVPIFRYSFMSQITLLIPDITACIWCHVHEKYGNLLSS